MVRYMYIYSIFIQILTVEMRGIITQDPLDYFAIQQAVFFTAVLAYLRAIVGHILLLTKYKFLVVNEYFLLTPR